MVLDEFIISTAQCEEIPYTTIKRISITLGEGIYKKVRYLLGNSFTRMVRKRHRQGTVMLIGKYCG